MSGCAFACAAKSAGGRVAALLQEQRVDRAGSVPVWFGSSLRSSLSAFGSSSARSAGTVRILTWLLARAGRRRSRGASRAAAPPAGSSDRGGDPTSFGRASGSRSGANARSPSSVGRRLASAGTTNATTRRPSSGSGSPATATSARAGAGRGRLDRLRPDLLPAGDDHVVEPAVDEQRPPSIDPPASPVRSQPSASIAAAVAAGRQPVAAHHRRAAQQDLPASSLRSRPPRRRAARRRRRRRRRSRSGRRFGPRARRLPPAARADLGAAAGTADTADQDRLEAVRSGTPAVQQAEQHRRDQRGESRRRRQRPARTPSTSKPPRPPRVTAPQTQHAGAPRACPPMWATGRQQNHGASGVARRCRSEDASSAAVERVAVSSTSFGAPGGAGRRHHQSRRRRSTGTPSGMRCESGSRRRQRRGRPSRDRPAPSRRPRGQPVVDRQDRRARVPRAARTGRARPGPAASWTASRSRVARRSSGPRTRVG